MENKPDVTIEALLSSADNSHGVSLSSEEDSTLLNTPSSSEKYRLGSEIAKGGMGAVLRAKDINIRRKVAMKVILDVSKASKAQVVRFIEEAQVTGQLEHPNIVPVYELGVDESGNPFYTMKMIKGVTLKEIIKEIKSGKKEIIKKYPLSRLLSIFMQVCNAVSYAHSKNVVHRDLKPENIMVGEYGEVLVVDWGLAKIIGKHDIGMLTTNGWELDESIHSLREEDDSQMTMVGQAMGTPLFMAPEQAEDASNVDHLADIYSLGAILYNILTLSKTVEGKAIRAILLNVIQGNIKHPLEFNKDPSIQLLHCPRGQIPEALAAVCMKALATKKENRYQNVEDLQNDIQSYRDGFATEAEEAGTWKQIKLLVGRNKSLFFSVTAALTILTIVVAVAFVNVKKEQQISEMNAKEARLAKNEAEKNLTAAERLNYANTVALAESSIKNGNFNKALLLLNECPSNSRHFEWHRLQLQCQIGSKVFTGHKADITTIYFSDDGKFIVSGDSSGIIKIWDVVTGFPLKTFRYRSRLLSILLSKDNKFLYTSHFNSKLNLWNFESGKKIKSIECASAVKSLSISPNGKYLISGRNGSIDVWSLKSMKRLKMVKSVFKNLRQVHFYDNNHFCAVGINKSMDVNVELFDMNKGQVIKKLKRPVTTLTVSTSSDLKTMATGHFGHVCIWDLKTGSIKHVIKTNNFRENVSFTFNNNEVFSGGHKNFFFVNTDTGKISNKTNLNKDVKKHTSSPVIISKNRKFVASTENEKLKIWDIPTGQTRVFDGILKGKDLTNVESKSHLTLDIADAILSSANFNFDNSKIIFSTKTTHIYIVETNSGKVIKSTRVHNLGRDNVNAKFCPKNNNFCYVNSKDIILQNTNGNKDVFKHSHLISNFDFSASGEILAVGTVNGNITLWNIKSKSKYKVINVFDDGNRPSLQINKEGTKILITNNRNKVKIIDIKTGIIDFKFDYDATISNISFTPGGKILISSELLCFLIDNLGKTQRTFRGHTENITSMAVSSDGKRLLTGSEDKTIKLWDIETGKELLTLEGHEGQITVVAFSSDDKMIISTDEDGIAKVWYSSWEN